MLASASLGEDAALLDLLVEAAQGAFERLVLTHSDFSQSRFTSPGLGSRARASGSRPTGPHASRTVSRQGPPEHSRGSRPGQTPGSAIAEPRTRCGAYPATHDDDPARPPPRRPGARRTLRRTMTTLLDRLDAAVDRYGERPALGLRRDDGTTMHWSFRELQRRARIAAWRLRAMDLEPGDRILTWSPSTPELPAAYYGAMAARLVLVPLDLRMSAGGGGGVVAASQ